MHDQRRRRFAALAATMATVALLLFGLPGTAQASVVQNVRFDTNTVDFAAAPDLITWAPIGSGTLTWEVSGNVKTPRLRGLMIMYQLHGFCGRMGLDYYDNYLATDPPIYTYRTTGVCPTNDGAWMQGHDLHPFSSASIRAVKVSVGVKAGAGPWYIDSYLVLT